MKCRPADLWVNVFSPVAKVAPGRYFMSFLLFFLHVLPVSGIMLLLISPAYNSTTVHLAPR